MSKSFSKLWPYNPSAAALVGLVTYCKGLKLGVVGDLTYSPKK
jgi:hypothetical protein